MGGIGRRGEYEQTTLYKTLKELIKKEKEGKEGERKRGKEEWGGRKE